LRDSRQEIVLKPELDPPVGGSKFSVRSQQKIACSAVFW